MPTIETTLAIAAPAAIVFDLAQDYGLRRDWDPFVRAIRSEGGGAPAVGARVWVKAKNAMTMTVAYVAFDRPRRVAVTMVSRSRLFERFAGSWSFEARAPDRTDVVFRYGFETRLRWLRPLLDRVIARVLTRDMGERLVALGRAAEDPEMIARLMDSRRAQISP
jgi:ribosome-associated toxin RatA of RatAB toxin-antitoxin module